MNVAYGISVKLRFNRRTKEVQLKSVENEQLEAEINNFFNREKKRKEKKRKEANFFESRKVF